MEEAILVVAGLMEISARTAPKAKGEDFIEVKTLHGEQKDAVGREMKKIGESRRSDGFIRDGENVLDSDAIVLIGLLRHHGLGTNCRACGYEGCNEFNSNSSKGEFAGPNCAHRLADLGIATGSAVKTAAMHNVDNRVMYRAGVAARQLALVDSNICYGIPLSATGKNIFFDRKRG